MPTATRYLALLRGINVGGKNIISKDDLRGCFEDLGLTSVRTYIQSGNILFRTSEGSVRRLTATIEAGLSERFGYAARAVVLPQRKYADLVSAAPSDWGVDQGRKHNALFTLAGTTPRKVLAQLPEPRAEVESLSVGPGVIFWSVNKDRFSLATVAKLAALDVYQQLTVRNHNTVFKLHQLFEEI